MVKCPKYSRTLIIWTPLCLVNHKSALYLFDKWSPLIYIICRGMVNYSNRTYTCWQNPNRTVTANVWIIKGSDNWGPTILLKGSSKNTSCGFNFLMEHTSVTTYSNWAVISCGSSLQWLSFVEAFYSLHQPLVCCSTWV